MNNQLLISPIDIRKQERHFLKKAALLQSVSISLIPIVSTISLVAMFAGYIASGHELAVSDVCGGVAVD